MLTIHPTSRFKRSFRKLPNRISQDFTSRVEVFRQDPFSSTLKTHKLHGNLEEYYAFYLRDGYRVLFEFVDDNNVVLVNVGSHDDYAKWE